MGGMPGAGPMGMGGARPGMEMPGAGPMGMGGAGASGDEQTRRQLIEGRYVDDKGRPLPYDTEFPYTKHPYAEFKMMPIRMNLVMDQRRLPKLLVECANSNMPIQVRRVRIMKSQGGSLDLGAGAAPAAGAGRGPAGPLRGMAAPAMPRPGGGGGGVRPTGDKDEGGPYDIPVEIQGVIYIYNPPDIERLGTGTASVEKPAGAAAPAAPAVPAPVPPVAAPVAPAPAAPAKLPAVPVNAPVAPPKP